MKGRTPERASWRRFELWYLPAADERTLVALVQIGAEHWCVVDLQSTEPLFDEGTYARAKLFVLQKGYRRIEGRIQLARRRGR